MSRAPHEGPLGDPGEELCDPLERLVEHGLERLFRPVEQEREVDLAPRIRRAWERGAPGPSLDDLEWSGSQASRAQRPVPPATRGRRPRAGRPRPTWPYAAAALAAGLVAWLVFGLRGGPAPLARLEGAVAGRLEGRWTALERASLAAGEPTFVRGERALQVALERGGTLRVQPGSLFTLEPDGSGTRVELEWGRLEARAGAAPLSVASAGTLARLRPGSDLRARLEWDRPLPQPDDLHVLDALRSTLARGAVGRLALEVAGGSVALEGTGGASPLAAGESRLLALETRGSRVIDADVAGKLAKGLDALVELAYEPRMLGWLEGSPREQLLALLASEPTASMDLAREVRRRLGEELPDAARRELLAVLALDRGRPSAHLAVELWHEHPDWFTVDHVVALAERGVAELAREVPGLAEAAASPEPLAPEPPSPEAGRWDPFLPCVYLALREDDRGVGLLLAQRGQELPQKVGLEALELCSRAMIAEIAVARLEGRPPRLGAACGDLAAWVRQLLGEGRFEEAVDLALVWEFFAERALSPGPPPVAFLAQRVVRRVRTRLPELEGPADVEALVARLAGR